MVGDQIYENEQRSSLLIDILNHIVEFRNSESGLHALNVRTLTELMLNHLVQKTDRYRLLPSDISMICTASALHDIGKISIDEKILNKSELYKREISHHEYSFPGRSEDANGPSQTANSAISPSNAGPSYRPSGPPSSLLAIPVPLARAWTSTSPE